VGLEKSLELLAWEDQAAKRPLRDDVGHGRLAQQARDLAEVVSGPQRGSVLAVDPDARRAIQDHVEARPGQALSDDALPFAEPRLVKRQGDAFELWRREVGEQRKAGQDVDDVFLNFQLASPPGAQLSAAASTRDREWRGGPETRDSRD
jgi:hypothetical protein